MENLIFFLTASLVLYKSSKKFRRVHIGETGCSALFSSEAEFDYTRTDDGDELYYAEHTEKKMTYGVLCARLHSPLCLDEAREVTANYMNRLRKPFHALFNTGIDSGATGPENAYSKMEDYWQDEYNRDWKVKGYTNGQVISILYIKNINEGEVEKQDLFLDSLQFPGK